VIVNQALAAREWHRGENENAFFSPFNEAAKRVPCPKSGNVGGIGLREYELTNIQQYG